MSTLKPGLDLRISEVKKRLLNACRTAGKPEDAVKLLAVSKTFPETAVLEAAQLGLAEFGENYVQEGCDKIDWFRTNHPELKLVWHMIGPLQSNKTRPVAERFDWVESVGRSKIARRLSEQRPADLPPLNVLVQVNIDGEDSKSGCSPEEALDLAREVASLPNLTFRGFMAIPAPADTAEAQEKPLRDMRRLFEAAAAAGLAADTLSMGMSSDMEAAVACGSTQVRIGSAIFGPRDYGHGH